ncbi:MAG TPA: hypothetical protein VHP81_12110 [Lachnospiraceae bacterium]|nr:hypothetical protein [Lachnospiraceae bacterium]
MDNIEKLTERDFKDNYVSKDISASIMAVWIFLFFSSIATFFSLALKNPLAYIDVIASFILGCLLLIFKSRIAAILAVVYYIYSFVYRLYNDYATISSNSLTSRYMWGLMFVFMYIKGAKEFVW